MAMKRTELHQELQGLADSLDEHVGTEDAAKAIESLAARVRSEGIAPEAEREYTPDDPRYPDVDVALIGQDSGLLSLATIAGRALRRHGVPGSKVEELYRTVMRGTYYEGLHELTCWVNVVIPDEYENEED